MILSAYQQAGGIQINRQLDAETIQSEMVFPGDEGWAEAMAAVAGFEALPEPAPVPTVEAVRARALASITWMRGQARLAYITDLPGQDAVLIAKLEEARAHVQDPNPDTADYPLIASEVGETAPTLYEVAQIILNLNALWRPAAGQIDAACFAAAREVNAAPDIDTIEAIISALAAALPSAGVPT